MANKVVLVRHGRSLGNEDHKVYGFGCESAVCLTTEGVYQSLDAGTKLRNLMNEGYLKWKWHPVQIITSQRARAIQTADIILERMGLQHLDRKIELAVDERFYGDGGTDGKKFPGHRNPHIKITPTGESLVECRERVGRWWDTQMDHMLSLTDVFIIAHGELIKCLVSHLLDTTSEELVKLSTPNGVPHIFEKWDDGTYIKSKHKFERFHHTPIKKAVEDKGY